MTTPTNTRPRLLVDIVSDPVCPWCYVGLKSFQLARDRLAEEYIVLPRIRAYQLNPDTPAAGVDRRAYYAKKFPDEAQRAEMVHQLKAAAMGAGFTFDPLKPAHLPNTLKAHQLIRLAHFDGAQERLAAALYAAYWDNADNIGDDETLLNIAEDAGLDKDNAKRDLENAASANEVRSEAGACRQAGVTGVPTFIVNERTGFSGALPPGRLADALRQAATAAA
ncbi:DsbA family oxidoreductase [Hyphococcus flavus]|uniref:DsbA family oxidoreductase n=1 Tax=Hyphococcus flavus TaxID=1866326 RepID=A0AAF0CDP2_9PROT|nr:DsbA family oxidoreductase [Hyphococcus flavus]WDI30011.1 DsbA family oxidoreductase [Hyphococcus flavus]